MSIDLALLKIPVSDLDRAVAFYENALGLTAAFSSAEFGWAQMEGLSVGLALYVPGKGGGDRAIGGSLDFHLSHSDLSALLDRALPHAADAQIHANADGSASLEFSDPDGNLLKLMGRQ